MTLYLDRNYINRVSPMLDKFSWGRDNVASVRCPFCGDSKKNPNKRRGYFFVKNNAFFYKCHNCQHSCNIHSFLRYVSPSLCKEYAVEKFKENHKPAPTEEEMFSKFKTKKPVDTTQNSEVLKHMVCIDKLPKDHPAVTFVTMRSIPKKHWNLLYYTDDFGSLMTVLNPDSGVFGKEERLVIPFFNEKGDIVAAQGRSLKLSSETNARKTAKYLTVKGDDSDDRLWYGQWRVDPSKRVYVVEGPLDSLFLPNAIAMVGAAAEDRLPARLRNSEVVYVLDNEPRNPNIVSYNHSLLKMNKTVCIWPDGIREKDINDMVHHRSAKEIRKIIDKNTTNGLEGILRLNSWKRCGSKLTW